MSDPTQTRPPGNAAGLKNILNHNDEGGPRDSGFYSAAEISSRHTSSASFGTNGLSPSQSGYQTSTDQTPSPVAGHMAPQSQTVVSPQASNMAVASIVSPTTPGGYEQRRLEHQPSMESTQSSSTIGESYGPGAGSRRESVDSRINQGFSDMRLNQSPYTSNNHSTTSIQNQLHSQRNPRPGLDARLETHSMNRISNGYAPSAERNPDSKTIRTAPAITGPATGNIARAAEPTKGQAWAFPEDAAAQSQQAYDASRRSSISESIASSHLTTDSRLPPGQRRLEDGPSPPGGHLGLPGEYPGVHHHSMQHRQLDDVQFEAGGPTGSQPYSRTPELRVSHKLAERKRRTEMKELFDALRDEMPQERGSKASKWEILTKAINEHRHHKEYIARLEAQRRADLSVIDSLQRQLRACQCQNNDHLLTEPPAAQQQPPRHPLPPQASQPAYAPGPYASAGNRNELPPLRSLSATGINAPAPESMTGVQYDAPGGANGYRQEQRY